MSGTRAAEQSAGPVQEEHEGVRTDLHARGHRRLSRRWCGSRHLSYLLAAQFIQDRMVAAESARTRREVKPATPREPKLHQLRRRFGRRSPAEVIVPTAAAGVVPPSH